MAALALDNASLLEAGGVAVSGSAQAATAAPQSAPVTLEELEREHILRVLSESNGNRERAAAILGISSRTLYRKLREYETQATSLGLATEG
jgi:DNA-binding NtrC family response regulator